MSEVEASALAAFGGQLKAWRKSRGWSQVALAAKIGYSDSLVSGIETMDRTPTLDFAVRCDDQFGAPGTFAALHVLVSREAWPSYFSPVLDAEGRATQIHEWESRDVPGLLQTEGYARSVICAGKPRLPGAELDRKVNGRMERQRIFEQETPPLLWSVLYEGALRHVIGSAAIMREQLDKLIAVASTPDVVIQVLPFTAHDHPGTDGPVMVLDFAGAPSVAYCECNGGGMLTETPSEVTDLMNTMNMIRAASLSPRDSLDLIRRIRSDLD